jgi:uncharacterized protein (TIGR02996 family)
MSTDRDHLLDALHVDPNDQAAWLVLADWLEEYDDPRRAELLRLVRRLRGQPLSPARLLCEQQAHRLLCTGVAACVPKLTNSVGMEFALIPPLLGQVGSPDTEEGRYEDEPQTPVELTYPYYLGVTAVTQAQFLAVMGYNPSVFQRKGRMRRKVEGIDTSRFPVEGISWDDAVQFCLTLTTRTEERNAGRTYRLPTEIEWELACRGEVSLMAPYPFGSTLKPCLANYRPSPRERNSFLGRPVPVGSLPGNAFGLHEMVGNVWEWCADWFQPAHYLEMEKVNPLPPPPSDRRVARGGTYNVEPRRIRSADRSSFVPDHREMDLGFRVVLNWDSTLPPGK